MEISSRDAGEVRVVGFEGNLDTNTSPNAQKHLNELVDGGSSKILVVVDKPGLRVLLATAKQLRANGGDLRLCGLNQNVQDVFEISGFSTILSVHTSESDALDGF